jgi:hypothetical protein
VSQQNPQSGTAWLPCRLLAQWVAVADITHVPVLALVWCADDDCELPPADEDEGVAAMVPLDAGEEVEVDPAELGNGRS